jgi:hypothetical protein
MHNSLKIIKTLLYSYSVLHVSGTLAPIIRSLIILHIQPPVTVCRWVGCIFQLVPVTTVASRGFQAQILISAVPQITVLTVISIAGVGSDYGRQNPAPIQHFG